MNKFTQWLKSIGNTSFGIPNFTGALLDMRPPEERAANDVNFSEIVASAAPVNWQNKYPDKIRKFPDSNQFYTNMCGPFSLAKSLGVMFMQKYGVYLKFFEPDIYQRRANKGSPGMSMVDLFKIAGEGVTLSDFFNATYSDDVGAEGIKIEAWQRAVGGAFAVSGNVKLPNDMETIASVIQQTGKAPIQLTYFTSPEWSKEFPVILQSNLGLFSPGCLHHFTVYTDFTLANGKMLVSEDSAWFGGFKRRFLNADWITNRVVEIRYPMNFKFQMAAGDRPSYDGLTVISAQKCLRYEGFFPTNIDYVENVGNFTKKALQLFQQKYGLAQTQALDTATKAKLLQLYP